MVTNYYRSRWILLLSPFRLLASAITDEALGVREEPGVSKERQCKAAKHHGMKTRTSWKRRQKSAQQKAGCSDTTSLSTSWKAYHGTITLYSKVTNCFLFLAHLFGVVTQDGNSKFVVVLQPNELWVSMVTTDRQESILYLSKPGVHKVEKIRLYLADY